MKQNKDIAYCICTEGSDLVFPYLRVMLLSLFKHNSWINGDMVILTCDITPLSTHNRKILESIVPNIKYVDIDSKQYNSLNVRNSNRGELLTNLYRINAFSLHGFDFVMYISSLSFCISSITKLFVGNSDTLVANSGTTVISREPGVSARNITEFNSSVMIISEEVLDAKLKGAMLARLKNTRCIASSDISNAIRDAIRLNGNNISYQSVHSIVKKSRYNDSKFSQFKAIQANVAFIELDIGINEKKKTPASFMYKEMNRLWNSYNIQGEWNSEETPSGIVNMNAYVERVKERKSKVVNSHKPVINNNVNESDFNISIIIPAYKASAFIEECLQSIFNQETLANIEILIGIDNCKITRDALIQIKDDYPNLQVFFSDISVGPYIIRNSLLDFAKYDNVLFFDADDIMKPGMISSILRYYTKNSPIRFKYLNFQHGKPYTSGKSHVSVAHGVFFSSREILDRIGGFQPWMCGADTEFMKRCTKNGIRDVEIQDYVFYRRIHGNSLTINAATNHRSKVRDTAKTFIRNNRDWSIPIHRKITKLSEI